MALLSEIIQSCETLWPAAGAESWDAPGLISGDPSVEIKRVLLSVDITAELITEAAGNYDLVLAHHPYLLRGVSLLGEDTAKGAAIAKAIRSSLALFTAHTNADIVQDGVSDVLASRLGILNATPLVEAGSSEVGHGRIGMLAAPVQLGEFARSVARTLPATATGVRVAGDYSQLVQKIAVCGGAGDSFISEAVSQDADVYLTADLRHHVVQEARESALLRDGTPSLIDVSHWASEWLWLEVACAKLSERHPDVEFIVSDLRTDPFDFVVTQ